MSKQLVFLTRSLVILFLFTLVALLHRLDSADLEKDIRALDLIQNIGALNVRPEFESGTVFRTAQAWLENNRPDWGTDTLQRGSEWPIS